MNAPWLGAERASLFAVLVDKVEEGSPVLFDRRLISRCSWHGKPVRRIRFSPSRTSVISVVPDGSSGHAGNFDRLINRAFADRFDLRIGDFD